MVTMKGVETVRLAMQRLRWRKVLWVCFAFWVALALDLSREAIIMERTLSDATWEVLRRF